MISKIKLNVSDVPYLIDLSIVNRHILMILEFNDKELSKMAKHLLEDWTFILKKLDVTLVEIKHIENLHPREMRRQALEGLTMWHKKSSTLLKDLLNVFRNNERQDMIELFEEMQGKNIEIEI